MALDKLRESVARLFGGRETADVSVSRREVLAGIGLAGLAAIAGPALVAPDEAEAEELIPARHRPGHRGRRRRRRRRRRRGRRRGRRRMSWRRLRRRCRYDRRFRYRNRRLCRRVFDWRPPRRGACIRIGPVEICE